MTPTFTTRLALESRRRFDAAGKELGGAATREAIGFLGVERAFDPGGTWRWVFQDMYGTSPGWIGRR